MDKDCKPFPIGNRRGWTKAELKGFAGKRTGGEHVGRRTFDVGRGAGTGGRLPGGGNSTFDVGRSRLDGAPGPAVALHGSTPTPS